MAIGSKSSRTSLVAGCATCVGEIAEDGSVSLESGASRAENITNSGRAAAEPREQQLQLQLRLRESQPQHQEETSGVATAATSVDSWRPSPGDDAAQTGDTASFTSLGRYSLGAGVDRSLVRDLGHPDDYQLACGARKAVGLTKVRLEDCLRCDACSCIYLDQSDYDKHMRNFHRHDSPKKHRQKRGCRSCCRYCNCRGDHQHQSIQKERGNNNLFHYNIKDRWTKMVSRRLNSDEPMQDIKQDPDDCSDDPLPSVDFSHLLSQVEVKIKTEPAEDQEFSVQ